jgi:hypothetical protein
MEKGAASLAVAEKLLGCVGVCVPCQQSRSSDLDSSLVFISTSPHSNHRWSIKRLEGKGDPIEGKLRSPDPLAPGEIDRLKHQPQL